MLYACSSPWADAQPIQPQRIAARDPILSIERKKLGQRFLLPAIEHIALKFRDDEREAGNLGRKVAQLNSPEVRQRNVRTSVRFTATLVDLSLDRAHLLVGDDKEVA